MRPGSTAFIPKAPKFSVVPPLARPWTRPLCTLRCLLRFGARIPSAYLFAVAITAAAVMPALVAGGLRFGEALILRHRVMREDLALEHPHLDAAGAVGGLGRRLAVIDIGAQGVQWHPALAIPFHAGDLGAAEPAGTIDADALGAEPHRRLDGPLHRAAESDPALPLLGDALGDPLW